MAKVRNNVILEGLSGSIGNLVFRQMPDGGTRVSAKPDFSQRVFSQEQKDHQDRFKQAVAYAREAAKTQPIYAELAEGTTKNAYNIALSDWFNPPVIHEVERKGGRLRVWASDNVRVTDVGVKIVDESGRLLEGGQAGQVDAEWWEYVSKVAKVEGKVEVTARDLAGNETLAVL
jgi:hypothetical protein